jgi:hypothetical protein
MAGFFDSIAGNPEYAADGANIDSVMYGGWEADISESTNPSFDSMLDGATFDNSFFGMDFFSALDAGFGGVFSFFDNSSDLIGSDLSFNFNPVEADVSLTDTAKSEGGGMLDALSDVAGKVGDMYGSLSDNEKGALLSGGFGLLKYFMASSAMDAAASAQKASARASMKNAETNRLTYELNKQKQDNAMASAGHAWANVPRMNASFAPPSVMPVDKRFGG